VPGVQKTRPLNPAHQPRQIADVIEVGVRQHDRVNRRWRDRKRLPVPLAKCFQPWKSPQSTSTRLWPCWTRYFDPVTVRAAPRNVS
jgi:hypothetical protein